MKKIFTLLSVFALSATAAFAQDPQTFTLEADFENGLPTGWKIDNYHFQCTPAATYGYTAHSGSNILGASMAVTADVIYTPVVKLAAGEPCTIEFYYNASKATISSFAYEISVSACSEQDITKQLQLIEKVNTQNCTDWTKVELSYIPDADTEVCFALNAVSRMGDNYANMAGALGYDSFKISGLEANGGG